MSLEEYAKKRFLVVDELDSFRFAVKKSLMDLGIKLIGTANSAQSVINGFQNVNYDVILCNYELGKGKNGQELLEELRFHKLLKFTGLFFIISAEVEKGKVMGTIENEPDGYLVKPVTPQDLEQRLKTALKIKDAMRKVDVAMDDGDFHSAIAYCDERIGAKDRYLARFQKTKAWLLTKIGELDQAAELYESILASGDPLWAEYGLAKIATRRGDFPRAETLLNRIIAKDPNQLDAMDLLAEVYRHDRRVPEAVAILKKAIQLSPNSLLRQKELADLCAGSGRREEAIEAFRKVIKLGDQSVYANLEQYNDFAAFLARSARSEEQSSANPDPGQLSNPGANSHAASNLNASPLVREAFELLNKGKKRFASQDHIDTQTRLMAANVNALIGNEAEARGILDGVLKSEGGDELPGLDVRSFQMAAQTLVSLGQPDAAEQLLSQAANRVKGDADVVSELYDQLSQNISVESSHAAALLNKKGIRLYQDGRLADAAEELRRALPLTPRHISLNLNLAQVLLKLHKENPTREVLKEVETLLHKVRNMPARHKEFRRYEFLLGQLKGRMG